MAAFGRVLPLFAAAPLFVALGACPSDDETETEDEETEEADRAEDEGAGEPSEDDERTVRFEGPVPDLDDSSAFAVFPADSEAVIGLSLEAIRESALWQEFRDEIARDLEGHDEFEVLRSACPVGDLEDIAVAIPSEDTSRVTVRARGVSKTDWQACLQVIAAVRGERLEFRREGDLIGYDVDYNGADDELSIDLDDDGVRIEGGDTTIVADDLHLDYEGTELRIEDGEVYVDGEALREPEALETSAEDTDRAFWTAWLDERTVLFSGTGPRDWLKTRADGKDGLGAGDELVEIATERVDREGLWFALYPGAGTPLASELDLEDGGARGGHGTLALDEGLSLDVRFDYPSEEVAAEERQELKEALAMLDALAEAHVEELGHVVDAAEISVDGAELALSLALSEDEINELLDALADFA